MSNLIMNICADAPEVGALACYLHDRIEVYAKKTPNVLLSYNDIFSITKTFRKNRGCTYSEETSLSAVHILCNPSVDFLKLKYFFIDDFNDPIEIEIKEVMEASYSNSLEHPYTGEIIEDYKSFIFPFFTVELIKTGRE